VEVRKIEKIAYFLYNEIAEYPCSHLSKGIKEQNVKEKVLSFDARGPFLIGFNENYL